MICSPHISQDPDCSLLKNPVSEWYDTPKEAAHVPQMARKKGVIIRWRYDKALYLCQEIQHSGEPTTDTSNIFQLSFRFNTNIKSLTLSSVDSSFQLRVQALLQVVYRKGGKIRNNLKKINIFLESHMHASWSTAHFHQHKQRYSVPT